MVVLDAFLFHEGLNLRVTVPLFAFILVPTDMHISVWEERGHLTQEAVQKLVNRFAGGIECRFKDSGASFDPVWPWGAAQLRITNQPARAMTRYVKLWHNADAAFAGINNNFSHLLLCVIETIRSH